MSLILSYIGPGAGVSLIGALIGLIGSIGFALLLIMLHPIRMMMQRRRANSSGQDQALDAPSRQRIGGERVGRGKLVLVVRAVGRSGRMLLGGRLDVDLPTSVTTNDSQRIAATNREIAGGAQ